MIATSKYQPARGFSLIEVLIAVVILSVGLLALASLQLSLIRSSSATKTQTIAASLAKEKIECMRSFSTATAATPTTCPGMSYRLLNSIGSETLTDAASGGNQGGIDFTRGIVVTRYVYNKATPGYETVANTLGDNAIKALNANYVPGRDFKRVKVTVNWVDQSGAANSLALEDVIDRLDPSESASIVKNNATTSGFRPLEQKIGDPSLDPMVIPIAVGNGTNSAASNPKPQVVKGVNTVETRFEVITYNGVSNGTATAQQRVETAMVGCTCTLDSPPASTVRGYRPTYWSGSRYAIPTAVDTAGAGAYSPPGKPDPASVSQQSAHCDVCCRDHHDPVGVSGATFSPTLVTKNSSDTVTATTHNHYFSKASGSPATSGTYKEACRLIRVDGIWSVAADLSNDYFALLGTSDLSNASYYASSSVPDPTATTNYKGFVVDYLDSRFTNQATASQYNTLPSAGTVSGLETTRQLNLPASVTIGAGFNGVLVTTNITGITKSNPATVTHGAYSPTTPAFVNGDRVTFANVGGMTQLNGQSFIIAAVTPTTFQLSGTGADSSAYTTYTSGGTASVNHGKWLHSRGLYVDYLEPDAIAAVTFAKANCASQSGSVYSDCVLKVLPFTSINLTELADWASADTTKTIVTNNDYSQSITNVDPVRGKVTFVPSAADATTVNVSSLSRKRNTGLLDLAFDAISVADDTKSTDAQPFLINNPTPPPPSPNTFYVTLSLAAKTGMGVNYVTGTQASLPCGGFVAGGKGYPCVVTNGTTVPLAGLGVANTMAIEVVGYNSETDATVTDTTPSFNCTNSDGKGGTTKVYTAAIGSYTKRTCNNYDITAASNITLAQAASGTAPYTVTSPGLQAEKTKINFVNINGDPVPADTTYIDMLNVTFGTPTTSVQPQTCTYTCSKATCATGGNKETYTITSPACP